jgi:uncharacterized protein (TIGR02302 family)
VSDSPVETSEPIGGKGQTTETVLEQAVWRARLTILWERLWPALAGLAAVLGLFLAVSWAGLWLWLPPLGRAAGLVLFALGLAVAAIPLLRVRLPSGIEGLRRLDRGSGLPHRPATAIADDLAVTASDPVSLALWRAHLELVIRAARTLKAGLPTPHLAGRDPLALRALVLFMVVAAFFAATGERTKRIAAAFDWQGVVAARTFRVDAWVTPPTYTGKPPVILAGIRQGEPTQAGSGSLAVPAGSALVVRSTGDVNLNIRITGGLEEGSAEQRAAAPTGTEEKRFTIKDAGSATVHGVGNAVTWSFAAVPDRPPMITLAKDPEPQVRGSLLLAYKLEDDYGVTEARATFARKSGNSAKDPRPLFGPPEFSLVLPQARTRNGVGQTIKDLSEHPWSGVDVSMTLTARDEVGNEGRSTPHEFRLPERSFVKPVARALVEQRRNLALDANAKPVVLKALDALTIAPDKFMPELGAYLGLRSVYYQLNHAKTDDELRDVVASLWELALVIEDGNISDVEQALRAAQEQLRQALERGASEEEIKKLTDDLRAALDKFLQTLAEQLRKNPQQLARPLDRNTRILRSQDLQNLIDRLERLARSGSKDAARALLDQLQSMLENLQMAQPGQGMDSDDDMMSSLDELGDMIRKQQQLRDRTFREGQDRRRNPQRGQRGDQNQNQNQNQMGDLRQDQQALRDRLNQLMDQLRKRGFGQNQGQQGQPGQQGQGEMDQLGRAGDAMGDAEGQLGEGNADSAVDSQGKALEALRKGAQGLAQAMQQGIGPGPGLPGRNGQARAQQDTDPLGRPLRGRDYGDDATIKVPGEIDVQRARRILEELRRRFGEPARPQIELDYIERLLKDF